MGDRGRVVIPAETRKRLGLQEGDRFTVLEEDGAIRLLPLAERVRALRGAWAIYDPNRDLVEELRAERREAAGRE
jgi:AbrB family looped-hinge helix DNA binding protein